MLSQCVKLTLCIVVMLFLYSENSNIFFQKRIFGQNLDVKRTLCIVVMLFLYSESLFNPRSPLKRPVEIELILESAIFKSTNWFIPWKTVSGRKLMWLVSTSRIFSLVKLRMLGGRRVSQVLVMWSSCKNRKISKKYQSRCPKPIGYRVVHYFCSTLY